MIQRFSRARRRLDEGFTLIELLVVVVVLGVLSAVVVFSVRGTGDKGAASAYATDAKTVRTAQESFCAKFGQYGTEKQIAGVDPAPDGQRYPFLSEESSLHAVFNDAGGSCLGAGNAAMSGYTITCDATKAGCGAGGALAKGAGYWASTANMATPRYDSTNVGLPNGRVLAAGGRSNVAPYVAYASAEIWDPLTGKWSPTGSMAVNRWSATATALNNGKVLITGGFGSISLAANGTPANGQPVNDNSQLYDPATGLFTNTGSLNIRRALHSAVLLPSGKVLATGGRTCSAAPPTACNSSFVTNTAELYDPLTGTWTRTSNNLDNGADNPFPGIPATNATAATSPQVGRHTTEATLLTVNCGANCGKVLVPAGFTGVSQTTADLYDPASDTWATPRATLVVSRARSGAMALQNGKVLVAAGGTGTSSNTSELYDPATNTFALTGSVALARFNYFYKVLPDGTVLIAGGSNAAIGNSELYDPATGLWKSAGLLRNPQGSTSSNANTTEAVLLSVNCGANCGKVLIVGQSPIGAAQLYTPGV